MSEPTTKRTTAQRVRVPARPYDPEHLKIPTDMAARFPELEGVLRGPAPVDQSAGDHKLIWTTRWSPPSENPFRLAYGSMNRRHFDILDKTWRPEADEWVVELVRTFQGHWPSYIGGLMAKFPEWRMELESLVRRHWIVHRSDISFEIRPNLSITDFLEQATFDRVAVWEKWRSPLAIRCDVCGARHVYDTIHPSSVARWGSPGICQRCANLAAGYTPMTMKRNRNASLKSTVEALKSYHAQTGVIPSSNFRRRAYVGVERAKRAQIVAAMALLPATDDLVARTKSSSWLEVLQRAGIVEDAWRPSRGTICTSKDGHSCRSLGEMTVDDYLYSASIEHICEPSYPRHSELNPRGRLRADWQLADGTYVEYAGMMTSPTYATKMTLKQSLAAALGLRLLIIVPTDLYHLPSIFSELSK